MTRYLDRATQAFDAAQGIEDAAAPIVDVLGAEQPPFRVQTSANARAFTGTKLADLDGSAVQSMTRSWVS